MKILSSRTLESFSEEETLALGRKIAEEARPGEIYALIGDLGVGKTALTHGIGQGLGITEPISSPTFTIVSEYDEGRMPLYHFDVYRIGDPSELEEAGMDDILYGDGTFGPGLVLVEWADLIEDLLPTHTRITIEKDLDRGFEYRRITIEEVES